VTKEIKNEIDMEFILRISNLQFVGELVEDFDGILG
jgi:hypothetical protein